MKFYITLKPNLYTNKSTLIYHVTTIKLKNQPTCDESNKKKISQIGLK